MKLRKVLLYHLILYSENFSGSRYESIHLGDNYRKMRSHNLQAGF